MEWGVGIFGFGHFFDRFFSFCTKKVRCFGFGVFCGLRVFLLLAFGFSVFVKYTSGFSGLEIDLVFGFSYSVSSFAVAVWPQ